MTDAASRPEGSNAQKPDFAKLQSLGFAAHTGHWSAMSDAATQPVEAAVRRNAAAFEISDGDAQNVDKVWVVA